MRKDLSHAPKAGFSSAAIKAGTVATPAWLVVFFVVQVVLNSLITRRFVRETLADFSVHYELAIVGHHD